MTSPELPEVLIARSRDLPTPTGSYVGFTDTAMYSLLYLAQRHAGDCVMAASAVKPTPNLTWQDVSIVWDPARGLLRRNLFDPASCRRRFALALLTLQAGEPYHANILMFDNHRGIIERWDPYERTEPRFKPDLLDATLLKTFPQYATVEAQPDLQGVGRLGLQAAQEVETELGVRGYCQPWTVVYADARLSFPDVPSEAIVHRLERLAADEPLALTRMIHEFAHFVAHRSRADAQKKGPLLPELLRSLAVW